MKRFYLAAETGQFQKSIYPLESSAIIGRSSRSDITFADLAVSSSHARVSYQKGNWVIEDLGSTNGLIFAGERISKKILQAGDTFQIGESMLHFMEKDVLEDVHHLSSTIRTFTEFIKHSSPLLESRNTEFGFTTLKDTLLSTQIFNSLEDTEFSKLEAAANLHLFGADQPVIQEGDFGRSTYIILDGRVRVYTKDFEGKEIQFATLGANQFFGEMALLTGRPRSSTVTTVEESLLSEISYNQMRSLMFRYPQAKELMQAYLKKRQEDTSKKLAEAGVQDRRRHPRLNERLQMRFTVWPNDTLPDEMSSHTYKGTGSNISLDGTELVVMGPAMEAFFPGCKLWLRIELPSPWVKFFTMGVIRRVIPGKHTVKLGIEFFDVSNYEKKKLKGFIYGEDYR